MVRLAQIRRAFALSNGTHGGPRLQRDRVDEGHEIGPHRPARLMRETQLIAGQKRRFQCTADSEDAWPQLGKTMPRHRLARRRWGQP